MRILILALAISFLYSGAAFAQPGPFQGCCQYFTGCENLSQSECVANDNSTGFVIDKECNEQTGFCPIPEVGDSLVRPVPTLSVWGLIAMAGILGIVSFVIIRRRIATNTT